MELIARRRVPARRLMIAIAGPPASGKTTLARRIVARIRADRGDGAAATLPMDGYHLDNATLRSLGAFQRKGAPETFDAASFIADLRRVRTAGTTVSIPGFDRSRDRVIPAAHRICAWCATVIVEGNYLLLRDPPWGAAHRLFDVSVFLRVPRTILEARLLARWRAHGLSESDARARLRGNDRPNADLVEARSIKATLELGEH